jgi:hypothetical protein
MEGLNSTGNSERHRLVESSVVANHTQTLHSLNYFGSLHNSSLMTCCIIVTDIVDP